MKIQPYQYSETCLRAQNNIPKTLKKNFAHVQTEKFLSNLKSGKENPCLKKIATFLGFARALVAFPSVIIDECKNKIS